jgi:hypothetical protein
MKLLIFILLLNFKSFSQDTLKNTYFSNKKNNLSLNIAGEALTGGTMNYERLLFKNRLINLGAGIGFGMNFDLGINYINPIYGIANIGIKKHYATLSVGINNVFDPTPFPNTKAEREEYKTQVRNKNYNFQADRYQQPYKAWYFINMGYTFIGKRGFVISPQLCLLWYKNNDLLEAGIIPLPIPKLKIGYAF